MKEIRVGNGFDVHKLSVGKRIKLCGIEIKNNKKLIGHSDADVGLHSLTDAILGALGKGDIGIWFPPSRNKWKNVDSKIFLKKSLQLLKKNNFLISNIDLTFICEKPKISEHRNSMINKISKICNLDSQKINIKATTSEKLGYTGRKEGIAVLTTVLIYKK
tara:strand:+ start:795 stop:1277 length:483 start_codon:yes stop_codon:yes gene_type:complete